jgi:hypothetical protein
LIGELWRLRGDTQLAARQLALGLREFLTLGSPWMSDSK